MADLKTPQNVVELVRHALWREKHEEVSRLARYKRHPTDHPSFGQNQQAFWGLIEEPPMFFAPYRANYDPSEVLPMKIKDSEDMY